VRGLFFSVCDVCLALPEPKMGNAGRIWKVGDGLVSRRACFGICGGELAWSAFLWVVVVEECRVGRTVGAEPGDRGGGPWAVRCRRMTRGMMRWPGVLC